jgi:predicted metal-dependent HD superfamily phosphohydrolase
VELAVWYHDVIYDVKANDNERESAKLFQDRARDRVPLAQVEVVVELIMVTVHSHNAPCTTDQGFMVDIELSSFGLPWERFIADSIAVREEFAHLTDTEFFARQRDFLASLLSRPHFCYTEFFRRRHEQRARENISRYLGEITERGLA